MFGGQLDINEFRENFKENKIFKMVEYPMFISNDYMEEIVGSDNLNDQDDYTNNEYFLYSDISVQSVMSLLKFIKNAEKRWNTFLADYDDLVENAEPKPLKIFINSRITLQSSRKLCI